jgi:hypothetical protein
VSRIFGSVWGWNALGWSFPREADAEDDGDLTWWVTCVQGALDLAAVARPLAPGLIDRLRAAEITLHGYADMGLDPTGEPCLVAVLHTGDLWVGVEVEADDTWTEEDRGELDPSDLFVYTGPDAQSVLLGLENHRRMEPFTAQGIPPGRDGYLSAEVRSAIAALPAPNPAKHTAIRHIPTPRD